MNKKIIICFMFLLFANHASASSAKILQKTVESWNGKSLPSLAIFHPEVTVKEITIHPGETLPVHLHPVINAGVLIEGELTVYTEDRQQFIHLKANTDKNSIVEMVNQYHFGVNEGTIPAKIIVFYISDEGEALTLLKP